MPVILIDRYQVADSPRPFVLADRIGRKEQTGDDAGTLNQIEPMLAYPLGCLHPSIIPELALTKQ